MAGSSSSVSHSESASDNYIPEYSESPILREIATHAREMSDVVYNWGMDQFNKNQGDIDSMMRDALSYASPQRIAVDMGMAEAGVQMAAERGRQSAIRDLESYGIDPSSGRYAALDQANRVMASTSAAGAGNQQRMADQAAGNAMRNQAISAGLQNSNFGSQVGRDANALLQTGMSLKYPPLGRWSTSVSDSSSQSVTADSGGGSKSSPEDKSPQERAAPQGGGGSRPSSGGGGSKPSAPAVFQTQPPGGTKPVEGKPVPQGPEEDPEKQYPGEHGREGMTGRPMEPTPDPEYPGEHGREGMTGRPMEPDPDYPGEAGREGMTGRPVEPDPDYPGEAGRAGMTGNPMVDDVEPGGVPVEGVERGPDLPPIETDPENMRMSEYNPYGDNQQDAAFTDNELQYDPVTGEPLEVTDNDGTQDVAGSLYGLEETGDWSGDSTPVSDTSEQYGGEFQPTDDFSYDEQQTGYEPVTATDAEGDVPLTDADFTYDESDQGFGDTADWTDGDYGDYGDYTDGDYGDYADTVDYGDEDYGDNYEDYGDNYEDYGDEDYYGEEDYGEDYGDEDYYEEDYGDEDYYEDDYAEEDYGDESYEDYGDESYEDYEDYDDYEDYGDESYEDYAEEDYYADDNSGDWTDYDGSYEGGEDASYEYDDYGDSGDSGGDYARGGVVRKKRRRRPMRRGRPMRTGFRPPKLRMRRGGRVPMRPGQPPRGPRQMDPPPPGTPPVSRPARGTPIPNRGGPRPPPMGRGMGGPGAMAPGNFISPNGMPPPAPGGMPRPQRMAGGGQAGRRAEPTRGGFVSNELSPSRGSKVDDVDAKLNAGEFVVPKDVAAWKGKEFFYKLITQARANRAGGGKPEKPQVGYTPGGGAR